MTDTPAPMQPGPSPTGGGPRRNPAYVYQCEICGEPVALTHREYDDAMEDDNRRRRKTETTARRTRRLAPGVTVRCSEHERRQPEPAPAEHPANVRARNTYEPRHLPASGEAFHLSPRERRDYGAIVTIRDVDGNDRSLVGKGTATEAMASMVQRIDALNQGDPSREWRVVSFSTPRTIHTDLQGKRDHQQARPETLTLARIRRLDLLHSSVPTE